MIRVVLVDDQPLIRAGFRALLSAEEDIDVVAEAADGLRGVELAVEHSPDVALIDVQMPVLDGIEATRRIAADERLSGVHVVILTNYGLDEYVYKALRAGACGFLVKDTEPEDLLHGVRVAARGEALLSPSITRRLIGPLRRGGRACNRRSTCAVPASPAAAVTVFPRPTTPPGPGRQHRLNDDLDSRSRRWTQRLTSLSRPRTWSRTSTAPGPPTASTWRWPRDRSTAFWVRRGQGRPRRSG